MTYDDVPAVERVTAAAFYDLDVRTRPADWPTPEPRSPERAEPWLVRLAHLVEHDQPGCWVADDDGTIVGVVAALLREGLWGLSTYAVQPGLQARGTGKALLDAALTYGDPAGLGIICGSHDPKAVRRYRLAGFDLHPAMLLWGEVRRAALPAVHGVRAGNVGDVDMLDAIDRQVRGAGHGPDHVLMATQHRLLVLEDGASRGYAYLYDAGVPYLLAATDAATSTRLLWAGLAEAPTGVPVDVQHLTSRHGWAIDVGLAAGLEVHNRGYLCYRAMDPPTTYLPSGHFL